MVIPRAIVLRAAGINCDQEARAACEKVGFRTDVTHVNRLIENQKLVQEYHFLIVPGGFSFGDDLGAGKVLANELKARLVPEFRDFIKAGKLILGICNGFQVLTKAGLLPEPMNPSSYQATLGNNDSGKFEDRWIRLKVSSLK
ncbi:MAG TPA: phosphoribosylformylglycinamidine synthase subunit PurQ, partial [Planctomycetota bacterium]|nr:phosphoribosylformylglycinamidine synthase subunit PurQ [Planctomycetota bacterium]